MGEMVEFASNGGTTPGYLAVPAGGNGPGVVVVQEYWGLVPHIKNVADRLAREGFTALVPDLFHGKTTTEPDEAAKQMMALRMDAAARDLSGAVQFLLDDERATGDAVGAVGFCMGGGLALYAATLRPEIRAVVVYYGLIPWPDANPDFSRIRGRILGHFGDRDGYAGPEQVAELLSRLEEKGVRAEFHTYAGADHAFFNDDRPEVYRADDARLSWDRTLAFLRRDLD